MFYTMVLFTMDLIDRFLMRLSPKYKASCFYQDSRRLYVPGDHEFNVQVREILLEKYGCKPKDGGARD